MGLTCTTFTYAQARRVAAQCRERLGAITVLGGPHLTALPESMDSDFDFGVAGEGEQTFLELVEQLLQTSPPAKPGQIPGLIHWRNGERVINSSRLPIEDLDSLPLPDRSLYDQNGALRRGSISIMTSRGCPLHLQFLRNSRALGRHAHPFRRLCFVGNCRSDPALSPLANCL